MHATFAFTVGCQRPPCSPVEYIRKRIMELILLRFFFSSIGVPENMKNAEGKPEKSQFAADPRRQSDAHENARRFSNDRNPAELRTRP